MGTYVYKQKSVKKVEIDGVDQEIGRYGYLLKPFWDVWDYALDPSVKRPFSFWSDFEQRLFRAYKSRLRNMRDVVPRKFFVTGEDWKQGLTVYEIKTTPRAWYYDDPTFGTDECPPIGKLEKVNGKWVVIREQGVKNESLCAENVKCL